MQTVFLVEDDEIIAQSIKKYLETWGMKVECIQDFNHCMEEFEQIGPSIVLLDIGLPFFNGYHWCSQIRKVSKVPVIFISSASDNMNIVMAMNMGGDDFIAKPFDQTVLIAKMQAMFRRTYDFAKTEHVLQCREAVLNVDDHSLTYRGEQIALSRNEYGILKILME